MDDWLAWVKIALAAAGAGLVSAAQTVEPSEAVWIMSAAGAFLGVALREDKSVPTILVHVGVGAVLAIALATLGDFLLHFPRPPIALLGGLFGARWTVAVNKDIDDHPLEFLARIFRKGP